MKMSRTKPKISFAGLSLEAIGTKIAAEGLNGNEKAMLLAVQTNGLALQYGSLGIKENLGIAQAAVEQNGLALKYVDKRSLSNVAILIAACKQNVSSLDSIELDQDIKDRVIRSSKVNSWDQIKEAEKYEEEASSSPSIMKKITDLIQVFKNFLQGLLPASFKRENAATDTIIKSGNDDYVSSQSESFSAEKLIQRAKEQDDPVDSTQSRESTASLPEASKGKGPQ